MLTLNSNLFRGYEDIDQEGDSYCWHCQCSQEESEGQDGDVSHPGHRGYGEDTFLLNRFLCDNNDSVFLCNMNVSCVCVVVR